MLKIPVGHDTNTGLSTFEMNLRQRTVDPGFRKRRERILRRALVHGAAWELPSREKLRKFIESEYTIEKLHVVKRTQKRLGAGQVKHFEKVQSAGESLSQEESTLFRMLAARSNYLSLDRPDIQFATKELCRGFASPTKRDHRRLKRLVCYLLGRPRLI